MDRDTLLEDQDLKNIYLKMLDYLSQNDMAEQRLVDRINRLKLRYPKSKRYERYSKHNAWKVIPLLRADGYLDEKRFAERILEFLKDKKDGLRVIRRKMLQRQINIKVVDSVLKKYEMTGRQDLTRIIKAARVKNKQLHDKFSKDAVKKLQIRQKLYSWLVSRGYSFDEISCISAKIRNSSSELDN